MAPRESHARTAPPTMDAEGLVCTLLLLLDAAALPLAPSEALAVDCIQLGIEAAGATADARERIRWARSAVAAMGHLIRQAQLLEERGQ